MIVDIDLAHSNGSLDVSPYDPDGDGLHENGAIVVQGTSGNLGNSGEDIEIVYDVPGVDGNSDGDFDDLGVDNNGDGDFDDPGVDANGDGDYDDEGDTLPDVAPVDTAPSTVVVDFVDYEDGINDYGDWGTSHDGGGPSLELVDYNSDNSLAENWQSSWIPNGTPGDEVSSEPEAISLTIQDIQYVDGDNTESTFRGQYVETSGIITGIDSIGTGSFIIQDGSGAWNGIYLSLIHI